jgi:hypothetical protein
MGSLLTKRMNHYQCNAPKFEEAELANHISIIHDVDTTTRSEYLASLDRRIKALEGCHLEPLFL